MSTITINVDDLTTVNGILVQKVGETLSKMFPKTSTDNVEMTSSTGGTVSLTSALQELATEISNTMTEDKTDEAIQKAMSDFTTELASKVSAEDGKELIATALLSILSTITTAQIESWNASQANLLESVTVNGVAQTIKDKNVEIPMTLFSQGSEIPDDMKNGDLFFLTS